MVYEICKGQNDPKELLGCSPCFTLDLTGQRKPEAFRYKESLPASFHFKPCGKTLKDVNQSLSLSTKKKKKKTGINLIAFIIDSS